MKKFIEKNFTSLVVLVLVIVILLQNCNKVPDTQGPTVIRDTTWVYKDTTVYSKPQIIKTIPVTIDVHHDTTLIKYLPDTNAAVLRKQYQTLLDRFLEMNTYRDSLRIDTTGYVIVDDTVSQNQFKNRRYRVNIKYPVITEKIILPPKRQLYVGGLIQGTRTTPVNQLSVGLLYKNQKEQLYGLSAGLGTNGEPVIGIQSFWKITLKK